MIDEVLGFWFGAPATTTEEYGQKMKRWYMGGPVLDAEIRAQFTGTVERALAGELDDWAKTLRGRLALVIALDQFPRSVYRDDPRSYAGDDRAQVLGLEALDCGLAKELPVEQRHFMIMPLMHAENVVLQERCVIEMEALFAEATDWQQAMLKMGVEQSRKYRDIIGRFGRFPHRNALLGRTSTKEEEAFLVDWQAKMAPSGAKEL